VDLGTVEKSITEGDERVRKEFEWCPNMGRGVATNGLIQRIQPVESPLLYKDPVREGRARRSGSLLARTHRGVAGDDRRGFFCRARTLNFELSR
jgi:hypothetical protein